MIQIGEKRLQTYELPDEKKAAFVFEEVNNFRSGLAGVCYKRKWGVISNTGAVVIPFIYDYADSLGENLICVTLDGHSGAIDV